MKKTIKKVVDGIEREIVINTCSDVSYVEFYENKEIQLLVKIPENIIKLKEVSFSRKKYASIFRYYLFRGIWELSYEAVESMVNTRCRKCDITFLICNRNDINIMIDDEGLYSGRFIASYTGLINDVLFEFTGYCARSFTYRELYELDKTDLNVVWEKDIFRELYWNKHKEACFKIKVNNMTFSMLESIYNRLNSDEYLESRKFFEEGGTLFDITEEQNRIFTKNIMLKQQEDNFIKYVEFDGSIII